MPVKLSDRTSTFGETDIYSTHDSNRGALGFHSVNSILERNNITLDRRKGTYEAEGANTTPKPFFVSVRTGTEVKLYWLSNEPGTATTTDTDWTEFIAGAADPFQGFFNPATCDFTDATGTKGHYWIATVAGTYNAGSGPITYSLYDKAQHDGFIWQKVGGASAVADWNTMLNKPAQFPPTDHQHTTAQVIGLDNQLQNLVPYAQIVDNVAANATDTGLIPSTHAVAVYSYSKSEVDTKISNLGTYGISYSWAGSQAQLLQTGMKAGELGLRQDEQKVYRYSGTGWIFFFSVASSGGATTEAIYSDVAIGGIKSGQLFPIGTTLTQFMKALLKTTAPAVYTQPTFTIELSPITTYAEIGSTVNVTIEPLWGIGDSGGVSDYSLSRIKEFVGSPLIPSNSSPIPYSDTFTLDTEYSVTYIAATTFAAGPVKNDSAGNPSPNGKIQQTVLSQESTAITPVRMLFYGFNNTGGDSANIRILTGKILNPTDGMQFDINVPAGVQDVIFAYPSSLGDLSFVYDNTSRFEITTAFTKSLVNVQGANGYTAIQYNQYLFHSLIPLDAVRYTVTI
jgi:hypothetical protein